MNLKQAHWGRAIIAALAAETMMIAAAFGWVAIYSYLIHPGEAVEFYREYAQTASPYVALALGLPVFFLACSWAGRSAPRAAMATAFATFGIYCAIELPFLFLAANPSITAWFAAINFPTKILGCYLGGMRAARWEDLKAA